MHEDSKKVVSRLFGYIRPYLSYAILGTLFLMIAASAGLFVPMILGKGLIDEVLLSKQGLETLKRLALFVIGLYTVREVLSYFQHYFLSYLGNSVVRDMRKDVFERLLYLPLDYHHNTRRGEIISKATNDINVIHNAIGMSLGELVFQVVTLVGVIILIFVIHWRLALVSILVLPIIALIVSYLGKKLRILSKQIQAKLADISATLQEVLAGIRVVKAYGAEERELENLKKENDRFFHVSMESAKTTALVIPVIELISISGMLAVIWYGSTEVLAGRLTSGSLVAFVSYLAMTAGPITSLSRLVGVFQQALASCERVFELVDKGKDEELEFLEEKEELSVKEGRIEFKNVDFSYEEEKILDDISFSIEPSEVIAVVGPSGSGKTTLVNLLMRFYSPDNGTIAIDGQDISDVTIRSLRGQIGLVPQETFLFSGTIFESIAYGKEDATLDEVVWAAKQANAHEFIERLPQGYSTVVGEEGTNLSGGQRQRIALARAIVRRPKILILDEATSALDAESERAVQEAFEKLLEGRTTIIIAHRLSTIKKANRILVIKDGQIAESGNHDELIKQGGLYYKLYFGVAAKESE